EEWSFTTAATTSAHPVHPSPTHRPSHPDTAGSASKRSPEPSSTSSPHPLRVEERAAKRHAKVLYLSSGSAARIGDSCSHAARAAGVFMMASNSIGVNRPREA